MAPLYTNLNLEKCFRGENRLARRIEAEVRENHPKKEVGLFHRKGAKNRGANFQPSTQN